MFANCAKCDFYLTENHDFSDGDCICGATEVCKHNWGAWVIDTQPTLSETGSKHRVCSLCNEEEEATIPIAKLDTAITIAPTVNVTQTINLRFLMSGLPKENPNDTKSDVMNFYVEVKNDRCKTDYNFIEGGYTYTVAKNDTDVMFAASNNRYYFLYNHMRLYELNIPITATVYCLNSDGEVVYISEPVVTTVADKVVAQYNSSGSANAKTLYSDIIELAKEAQVYAVNGKDVALKNYGYEDFDFTGTPTGTVDKSKLNTTNRKIPENSDIYITPSFNVAGSPAIRFMVEGATKNYNVDNLKLVISYESTEYTIPDTIYNVSEISSTSGTSGNRYYTLYSGVALCDGNQTVTAKLYNGSIQAENLVATTEYSFENAIANTTTSSRAYNLYMTVAKVGISARTYFGVS